MRKYLFSLVLILLVISSFSQEFLKIKGVIFETNSDTPISFANVSICNKSIGVASNEFGEFVLNLSKSFIEENICISAIGYETYTNSIKNLINEEYNKISLSTVSYDLNEALIIEKRNNKFSNPIKIIEMALENFKQNYSFDPFVIQAYYREYAKYGENNYLNLLEAGIILKDKGFQESNAFNQSYMLQYRYNEDFKLVDALESNYINDLNLTQDGAQKYMPKHDFPIMGGNELSILFLHDAIRRYNEKTFSYINKLDENFIPNHKFKLEKIALMNNIPIYQISFEYKDNYSYSLDKRTYDYKSNIQGEIFIESNTYAIQRIEYTSYSLRNSKNKNFEIISEYQRHKGKMYLKYLSFSNSFNINASAINFSELDLSPKKTPLRITEVNIDNEILIIRFNNSLNKLSAKNKSNYHLSGHITWHEDSKIVIHKLKNHPEDAHLADSKILFLKIPNLNRVAENNKKIEISNSLIKIGEIEINLKNVKDNNGSRIDDKLEITMHQFRELFVNEIQDNLSLPSYARTIFPNLPLYDQKPLKVDDFWENFNYPSNVPLQNNYR